MEGYSKKGGGGGGKEKNRGGVGVVRGRRTNKGKGESGGL